MNDDPIEVSTSPIPAQLMAAFRVLLMLAGGSAVTAGYISQEQLIAIVGAVLTISVFAWSQWATRSNAKKAAVMAEAAPNSVAVTK